MLTRWYVGVVEEPLFGLDGHVLAVLGFMFAEELVGDGVSDCGEHSPISLGALFAWAIVTVVMEFCQLLLDGGPFLNF